MESVAFNGIDLTDRYMVFAKRGIPYQSATVETVPGGDGVIVTGADYSPPPMSLVFVLGPCPDHEMERRTRDLMSVLDTREPKRLELGGDGGLWCMAMPSGERGWVRHVRSCSVEVPMIVQDAAMYGRTLSVQVPSGGSVKFLVSGTYPTRPMVDAQAAVRDSGSQLWGVRLDDADFLHVATGSGSGRHVVIDCGERVARVSGSLVTPTLDSDWLQLEPGEHTLKMDLGTGAATVTYTERWL